MLLCQYTYHNGLQLSVHWDESLVLRNERYFFFDGKTFILLYFFIIMKDTFFHHFFKLMVSFHSRIERQAIGKWNVVLLKPSLYFSRSTGKDWDGGLLIPSFDANKKRKLCICSSHFTKYSYCGESMKTIFK